MDANPVETWLRSWRVRHRESRRPPFRFGGHLSACASRMTREGTDATSLLALFDAAGHDAVCPCGRTPAQPNVPAA